MEDMLAMGRRILDAQPFSRWLGAELSAFEPGQATLTLDVTEQLFQQHGYVHGGVLSYLADNALTFAGGSHFGDAVTVEFKVNYVKPARGERLRAEARTAASGSRIATCQCDIWVESEGQAPFVCAVAQGTIMGKR
ncbi:PaaI family thioesterase [Marinobacteraceae bacterium S3BR75-40.1]